MIVAFPGYLHLDFGVQLTYIPQPLYNTIIGVHSINHVS